MNFDEIVLTKEELKALRIVNSSALLVDADSEKVLRRLEHFGFVEIHIYEKMSGSILKSGIPRIAEITQRGRDYLAYIKQKWKNSRRKFWFGLLCATAGSLFTYAADRLPQILSFLKHLLDQWGK